MRCILIIALFIGYFETSGQWLTRKLSGQWKVNNTDSSYFKSDTLSIDNDLKFEVIEQQGCEFILWEVKAKRSRIFAYDNCEGKWNKRIVDDKVLIELRDIGDTYFIVIQDSENKTIRDKFAVTYYTEDKGMIKGKKWKAFGLVRVK